ncbi:Tat pathway signal sequence domain protein [Zavarzinia sp.]|uniref:Tat pathway signal sequence domain protein n=1 Tax=Zavarzinia sp. TaxID=2027920 RepID=UPI00356491CD
MIPSTVAFGRFRLSLAALAAAGLVLGTAAAHAEQPAAPAPITVELNKLEPQPNACRAYLVLSNPGGPDITDLKLDLILFNQDQVIEKRIAVSLAPLPAGKTSVKLFDIDNQDCGRIGSVLINDVIACTSADGAVPECSKRLQPSTRVSAKLFM